MQPQGGLFVWARLTGAGGKISNGNDLAKRAIEQGVAFVPGVPFYATHPDPATLRLSFATADVAKIEEGVGRLAQALGGIVDGEAAEELVGGAEVVIDAALAEVLAEGLLEGEGVDGEAAAAVGAVGEGKLVEVGLDEGIDGDGAGGEDAAAGVDTMPSLSIVFPSAP